MAVVPLRSAADTDGRGSEILRDLEASGRVMPILRSVANAESAFPAFIRYSAALVRSLDLPGRLRELVIMRAASSLQSGYEWAEHLAFAREAGVTESELASLRRHEIPSSLSDDERLVLQTVDDLLANLRAPSLRPPPSLGEVRARLGPRQYTELALVLGWWIGSVPMIVAVLGLEADVPGDASVL
jgi:alkylhydroperoxidase family enzyme